MREIAQHVDGPALRIHALPAADGRQRCFAVPHGGSSAQEVVVGDGLGDLLAQLGDRDAPRLLLVDQYTDLSATSAHDLLYWFERARLLGTGLVVGLQPALDAEGTEAMLQLLPEVSWYDASSWDAGQALGRLAPCLEAFPADAAAQVAAMCEGSPWLTDEMARELVRVPSHDDDGVTRAYRGALYASVSRGLGHLGTGAQTVLGAALLSRPDVDVERVLTGVGLPRVEADRHLRLLAELGLLPRDPELAVLVRREAWEALDEQVRCRAARLARQELERQGDGCPLHRFHLALAAGEDLTGQGELARAALTVAESSGSTEAAQRVVTVLLGSQEPDEVAWARAAQIRLWARSDWNRLESGVQEWCTDPAVRERLRDLRIPPELGLERPSLVGLLLQHGVGDSDVSDLMWWVDPTHLRGSVVAARPSGQSLARTSWTAVRAWRGRPAEAELLGLDRQLRDGGLLEVSAPTAWRMALAWLALADYESALTWADLATFAAADDHPSESGIGYLVAAHALLRIGRLDEALSRAAAAGSAFERVGAPHLGLAAQLTTTHVLVEQGAGGALGLPDRCPEGTHPVLDAYTSYVRGRVLLAQGQADTAVRSLFSCGRKLAAQGNTNPSLVNWRPHLVAVFRAMGQHGFADQIETDLASAVREWSRYQPEAARRRRTALLPTRRHDDVDGASTATPGGLGQLSQAERRVVDVVISGCSNREAAQSLFLSKRTVDTHLSNVYRKLQVRSRQELVAAMQAVPSESEERLVAYG